MSALSAMRASGLLLLAFMIAPLSNLTAQTAGTQTGLGVILTEDSDKSHIYPQRGSTVSVRLDLPLLITGNEFKSVVMRKRSSWNIISPVHTEYWLELELQPDAAVRLNVFSEREWADVRLGLLLHDEVAGVIAFRGPITGRKIALYGFNRESARTLVDEIKDVIRNRPR